MSDPFSDGHAAARRTAARAAQQASATAEEAGRNQRIADRQKPKPAERPYPMPKGFFKWPSIS